MFDFFEQENERGNERGRDRCHREPCIPVCNCHPCPSPCPPPHPYPKCGCVPKPIEDACCSFVRVNCDGEYELARVKVDNGPLTNEDYNFAAYNLNPRDIDGIGMQASSGMLYLSRIELSCPVNVFQMFVAVSSGGMNLTAGQSLAGIYDGAGNLLAQTADQSAAWQAAGVYGMPIPATYLPEGRYYLALLSVGDIAPEFAASQAGAAALNILLSTPNLAYGQIPEQTTLPATVDPNTFNLPPIGQKMPWIALG